MYMKENTSVNEKRWIQEGNHITNGKRIIHIGDYVDYKPQKRKYTGKWIAIGATEGGNLMIMSEDPISTLKLGGKDGITNGVKQLNAICEKYASGEYAVHARSLTVEDVEKMVGISKSFDEETIEICWDGSENFLVLDKKDAMPPKHMCYADKLCWYDKEMNQWKESLNNFKPEKVTSLKTYSHITNARDIYGVSRELRDKICNGEYWLATPSIHKYTSEIRYGMHILTENLYTTIHSMVCITGEEYTAERAGVRAVVYLASDIKLEAEEWKLVRI